MPSKKTPGASGLDLFSGVDLVVPDRETRIVPCGYCIEIPEGMEAQIRPRSGLSKDRIFVSFGTIDSDYRGEVGVILSNESGKLFKIQKNDRIAQLVICSIRTSYIKFQVVESLSETQRGEGGFGSTGTS